MVDFDLDDERGLLNVNEPVHIQPFDNSDEVLVPNEVTSLRARPQIPFQPEAIFIPRDLSKLLTVQGIFIGVDMQQLGVGSIPAELFAWHCGHVDDCGKSTELMVECMRVHPNAHTYIRRHEMAMCVPGIEINLQLVNESPTPQRFRGVILGRVPEARPIRGAFVTDGPPTWAPRFRR